MQLEAPLSNIGAAIEGKINDASLCARVVIPLENIQYFKYRSFQVEFGF
jgi:hypothetical protein